MSFRKMVKRTLVIGDLHFDNKPFGLLEAQKKAVIKLFRKVVSEDHVTDVIFLGDLMMHRKPYPRVLLALQEVINYISSIAKVYIIRGNHDSENKSDDGTTALSLFDNALDVKVITQTWVDDSNRRVFVPHYEDEEKIKEVLAQVPEGYRIFGHFGYHGALNSAGDADFGISPSEFRNSCVLGHIHRFEQVTQRADKSVVTLTVLGTPYTTNFSEYKKENFYGIIKDGELTIHPIEFGPRHLVVDYDLVEENLDWINDKKYFTLLRINLSTIDRDQNNVADLMDKLDVGYVEVKYKPVVDAKFDQNEMHSENAVIEVDDLLIEEYINASNTTLGKEALLNGLSLIHENQQSRN